jgi:hypothetical protein
MEKVHPSGLGQSVRQWKFVLSPVLEITVRRPADDEKQFEECVWGGTMHIKPRVIHATCRAGGLPALECGGKRGKRSATPLWIPPRQSFGQIQSAVAAVHPPQCCYGGRALCRRTPNEDLNCNRSKLGVATRPTQTCVENSYGPLTISSP